MNKGQLIEAVATELDTSKAAAQRAVDAVMACIADGLKRDEAVTIVGFGSFARKQRAARTVRKGEETVELSQREFALLQLLMENAGKVIPRSRLEGSLYGWGEVESNTLEVYVHYLRKKLGSELIRTVRGVGYMLKES